MAKGIIRAKAKAKGGNTSVKIMAKHDMETGNRKDKKGKKIPAKYIQTMSVAYNGKKVMEANMGTAVSKNPYLAFTFEGGAKGDQLDITWIENTGNTGTETAKVR
ncbi:MAG: thiosulfate oxidation carrier complex protein SoxZ [Gammaproteobacteria bacterium]|jgi:sulfur-oxidizing protein SoxZ|nr:thiosulfate oxidation carrier complex protein SoxZ [Gammaproteobacteria bacterium]MCP4879834.1 thiosulfate oxidation carrier complex protein SoxZ [Gammaproteobacteria bacterium]MDP6166749.1 thiosulfate oxidation carrier complex protein SoxZ [Gammaproteobacteria bacterium]